MRPEKQQPTPEEGVAGVPFAAASVAVGVSAVARRRMVRRVRSALGMSGTCRRRKEGASGRGERGGASWWRVRRKGVLVEGYRIPVAHLAD